MALAPLPRSPHGGFVRVCVWWGSCRFVDEYILPANLAQGLKDREVTPTDISTHNTTDVDLHPDDIIVHNMKINYGSKVQRGWSCGEGWPLCGLGG